MENLAKVSAGSRFVSSTLRVGKVAVVLVAMVGLSAWGGTVAHSHLVTPAADTRVAGNGTAIQGSAPQASHDEANGVSNPGAPSAQAGTPTWTRLTTPQHPSARDDAAIAYDAADGYVVLFGGGAGLGTGSNYSAPVCYNDTWIFVHGVWTNLSIAGPPPTCDPAMAYDAADGVVLLYVDVDVNPEITWNQTWVFVHGRWSELDINNPSMAGGWGVTMTYDGEDRAVLLYGYHYEGNSADPMIWEFSSGEWKQLAPRTTPSWPDTTGLAYDAADGYAILNAYPIPGEGWGATPNATWAFSSGNWTRVAMMPVAYDGLGAVAYDSKDGYVVVYGGTTEVKSGYGGDLGETWLYRGGTWTRGPVSGPMDGLLGAMTFDAADGYVLLFGGDQNIVVGGDAYQWYKSETWIYSAPPVAIHITASVSPPAVCSLDSENCGAGTDKARLSVDILAESVARNMTFGLDTGGGSITYGPYYWVDSPTVTYLGWKNVTPAPNLDPSVACLGGGTLNLVTCQATPSAGTSSPTEGPLTWSWSDSASPTVDSLHQGEEWNITLSVVALGPPYGPVAADACTTNACDSAQVGAVNGEYAHFAFSPYGNSSLLNVSLPFSTLNVLPSLTSTSTAPSTMPPSSPPVGTTVPVASPVVPTPTPPLATTSPVTTPIPVALSVPALCAGVIAAGFSRLTVRRRAGRVAVAVASKASAPARREPFHRGV